MLVWHIFIFNSTIRSRFIWNWSGSFIKTIIHNWCKTPWYLSYFGFLETFLVPYKHREKIRNLSNNQNIVTMKQDKGRDVVIIDRNKYFDKCLALLTSEQFVKLNQDSTATTERKIQRILRKNQTKIAKGSIPKAISNRVVTWKVL